MIRNLLLTLLLLFSAPSFAGKVYGNLDPCVVQDGQMTCLASATPDEKLAWQAYHLDPSLDEEEVKALKAYKFASIADLATTGIGLAACTAVVESNPLGILILPGSYFAYKHLEKVAHKTSRYHSAQRGINTVAQIRGVVAMANVFTFARCF